MALKLRSLKIENFGCIRSLHLTGFSDINVLLGPNNIGKSTVLAAIAGLCSNAILGEDRRTLPEGTLPLLISGMFECVDPDLERFIDKAIHDLGITTHLEPLFKKHVRLIQIQKEMKGAYKPDVPPLFSLGLLNPFDHPDEEFRKTFPGWHDTKGLRRLMDTVGGRLTSDKDILLAGKRTALIPADRLGRPFFSWVPGEAGTSRTAGVVTHGWAESKFKRRTEESLKAVAKLDASFSQVDPRKDGKLYFEIEQRDGVAKELALTSKGLGENDVHELLARMTCHEDPLSTLCIDEPEASKHPKLQRHLMEWLLASATNTQIFLSTHSTVFAQPSTRTSVYVLSTVKGTLDAKPIGHLNVDSVQIIRDSVGARNLDILGFEKVLLVEGDTEEDFLKEYFIGIGSYAWAHGLRVVNLKTSSNAKLGKLKDFLSFLKDTWVRSFIWLDKAPDVARAKEEILQAFQGYLGKEDFVLWPGKADLVDFEDMFPRDVLADAFQELASEAQGPKDAGARLLASTETRATDALKAVYAEIFKVHKSDFPKPLFGTILGRRVAKEASGTGDKTAIESKYPVLKELHRLLGA